MPRLMTIVVLFIALSATAALAAAPYQLTSKVDATTDRVVGTFQISRASGPDKGKLVAAPRLTMTDGNIGRMKTEVDGSKHKLEISLIKAKEASEALVVFLVWDGKTIIQAETRRIELKP